MVILVSDNGASGEGGPDGSVNEMLFMNGIPDDVNANLAMLDELGGPKTYNHYPNGWAMAFNTPFKMWKRYEFNGGTSDPCVISWPAGMTAHGEIREQYHHAIDLVPTVLDALGIEAPATIKGHTQSHFDGVSMRYSFDDPERPGRAPDAVLLDARVAGHLARRLEGHHHAPDDQRVGALQRGRVGALPRRRRPLRAARPGGRAAGQAPRDGQPLVRRGRRQRGLPARRPVGAGDPRVTAPAAVGARGTATSTTPTTPRCPSPRPSWCAADRSSSARWSTSPSRAPRECSSRRGRASAATASTSRTTGCTTSTASWACSSRGSSRPRTCRPARTSSCRRRS